MVPRLAVAVHADLVSPELANLRNEVSLRGRYTDLFDNIEPRERITITTTVNGIDYIVTTLILPKDFLSKNKYLSRVLERDRKSVV